MRPVLEQPARIEEYREGPDTRLGAVAVRLAGDAAAVAAAGQY